MEVSTQRVNSIEKWAFRVLLVTTFLAPLIFLPISYIPLELIKTYIIILGVLVSLGLYLCVFFKERKIVLPPRVISYSAGAVIMVTALSAVLNHPLSGSLFGIGTEVYTLGFITALFVGAYLSFVSVSRQSERGIVLLVSLVSSFFVLALFHIIRFIAGANSATLGILPSLTSTVFGSWYALSFYAFIVALILVLALIYLPLSRRMSVFYGIAIAVSFATMFIINDYRLWTISALIFLGYGLYHTFSKSRAGSGLKSWLKRISWIPTIAFLVSVLFVWQGTPITQNIITKVGASYSELRLPWQLTLEVGTRVLENSPLLGSGPNQFTQSYISYKPTIVNAGSVWNVEFSSGSGFLPTIFATEGVLSIISWLALIVFFGIVSVKILKRLPSQPLTRFVLVSTFLVSVSGIVMVCVAIEPHAILFLLFITIGIFFGTAGADGLGKEWHIALTSSGKKITVISVLAVIVVLTFYVYTKNTVALIDFTKGASVLNTTGNTTQAEGYVKNALAVRNSDIFWRGLTQIDIQKIQRAASSVSSSSDPALITKTTNDITDLIRQGEQNAHNAISFDPNSYYNYLSLARVYNIGAQMKIPNAYESALANYSLVVKHNPYDPSIYLEVAQLQAGHNDLTSSIQTLQTALQIKPNYTDALALLLQIYVSQNDTKDAVATAEATVQIDPNNPFTLYQLGVLLYTTNEYQNAITVLERAVNLSPNYANAEYFLGLSYARLNRTADALSQFKNIEKSNPNNQDIAYIIDALQSGRSLFVQPQASKVASTSAKIRQSASTTTSTTHK